jgi:lysophospholipase L1-like esterase
VIAQYEFYVSADGSTWGTPLATGTFAKSKTEKEILFPDKPGRYVRLRALSEVNGNPWTSAAEIKVLGTNILSGDEYVAIGDSITEGVGDNISSDGIGYEPILANLLATTIANEGVGGVSSAYGAANISTTLAKYPSAKYYLILYGTNDANPLVNTPSGMGMIPGDTGYDGSYKDYMQRMITAIKNAGKTPYLALVPYTLDSARIPKIQEYNVAIDELWVSNGIPVSPPDFYTHFLQHQNEFADALHPNGRGYQSIADLWKAVIAP